MNTTEPPAAADFPFLEKLLRQRSPASEQALGYCRELALRPYEPTRPPAALLGATRAFAIINDPTAKARAATALLYSAAIHGQSPTDRFGYHYALDAVQGFARLYLPIATQAPDEALALTEAALAEKTLFTPAREQVMLSFADACFALLRKRPEPTQALLAQISAEAATDPQLHRVRDKLERELQTTLKRHAPLMQQGVEQTSPQARASYLSRPVAESVAATLAHLRQPA